LSIVGDLKMYGRFAVGLRKYLSHRLSYDEAAAIVRERMERREENFLRMLERAIFGYPRSPYLQLLKLAGCELGDIRLMVRDQGLEYTLRTLREEGVYVSFEEFKGRAPIARHGKVLAVRASDFDNPYLSRHYYTQSGGSTGAGTRVSTDLAHLAERAPYFLLAHAAQGVMDAPTALWHGVLPDSSGINSLLCQARIDRVPRKWFTPVVTQEVRPAFKYRLATWATLAVARTCGVHLPAPEPVRLDQAAIVARWAAETLRQNGACFISTPASRALRICLAAREEGLDIRGVAFSGGGEPLTPAKAREIERSGGRCFPSYFFTEVGPVGMSCAAPADANDQHFFKDSLALIQHPRQVPGSDIEVDAFNFTTLLPSAPKVMLNTEIDDYGVVETRSCGCLLESFGFTEHLRHIRSFRKLTGEGVTLVGSEMIRILEEVLPARFGGSPLDYQLLEEEDDNGLTRLSLIISPRLQIPEEKTVIDTVLNALEHGTVAANLSRALWQQAGSLRVLRRDPIPTARGKLMPLHLTRRAGEKGKGGNQAP
jgi:hypothetical protein